MTRKILALFFIVLSGATVFVACSETPGRNTTANPILDSAALVSRGQYLVTTTGCDDCHSPKRMGPNGPEIIAETRLSGYPQNAPMPKLNLSEVKKGFLMFMPDLTAAVGPWGISFAANLTPDATGTGNWTEENFIRALRHGKFKGLENSRDLLPPMPWTAYRNMTDTDLRSIFAYLRTIKPVENQVPAPKPLISIN
ncbi:MAG: c-type cytochrome [Chitinophagaceae bacterium]|nr:c-type cytochrome [Chitinophagaceae bacterium]